MQNVLISENIQTEVKDIFLSQTKCFSFQETTFLFFSNVSSKSGGNF